MKESIKVSLYVKALDFENIDNPLSFLLKISRWCANLWRTQNKLHKPHEKIRAATGLAVVFIFQNSL